MYFDMHVHDRGGKEAYKGEDERHALVVAEKAGVDGIVVMPNTNPPVTTRELVEEKLARADEVGSKVFYGIYIGLTSDLKQIDEAIKVCRDLFPRVPGMKIYMGRSVGDLAVTTENEQRRVFGRLGYGNYKGVLIIHAEEESLLRQDLWDPRNPISHCRARPPEAELEAIKRAVLYAMESEFRGWLHITHVSTPEAVKYINSIKRNLLGTEHCAFRGISCDATPHHLFMYDKMMNLPGGIVLKVNPALRTREQQQGLLQCLKEGLIDCIATDSAPHSLQEKLQPPHLSGYPGLDKWPRIVKKLREGGLSQELIDNLTFNNPVKILGLGGCVKKSENPEDLNLNEYSYGNEFWARL